MRIRTFDSHARVLESGAALPPGVSPVGPGEMDRVHSGPTTGLDLMTERETREICTRILSAGPDRVELRVVPPQRLLTTRLVDGLPSVKHRDRHGFDSLSGLEDRLAVMSMYGKMAWEVRAWSSPSRRTWLLTVIKQPDDYFLVRHTFKSSGEWHTETGEHRCDQLQPALDLLGILLPAG